MLTIAKWDVDLLPLPDASKLERCRSMTQALIECQSESGLMDKELCGRDEIISDTGTWSRIKKSGNHHFPQDKLCEFMRRCGNAWPLAWLANANGYALKPKETEMQRQLRLNAELIAEQAQRIEFLEELISRRFQGVITIEGDTDERPQRKAA